MISRNGSSISYTSFNLPSLINAGTGYSSTLSYGAFRNRYKQIAVTPSTGTETTIYVAGLLEKVTRSSGTEYRHYIAGGQGAAAIYTRISGGASSTYYLHRDHLGSPELITDSSGLEVVRPSFGAYGERRDGTDWDGPPSTADLTDLANTSRRGFTGHEHLESVALIHMNGRVYEPVAGRFLGVDPILSLGQSQDVNSYSYTWNNPLSVTDPSGFVENRDVTVHQCISCDSIPYYSGGIGSFFGFMDGMGWLDYREPTIEEKRRWVFSKPGDAVDVFPADAKWDGGGAVVAWQLSMRGGADVEATSVSDAGRRFIKSYEGPVDLNIYLDPADKLTIGFGHLLTAVEIKHKKFEKGITNAEAETLFEQDLAEVERAISDLVQVPLSQQQYDAVASLIFNVGRNRFTDYNVRKYLNSRRYADAAKEFRNIDKIRDPNTKKLRALEGLTRRKLAEIEIFLNGVYVDN